MNATAVLVTYNRLNLLKTTLDAYFGMKKKFNNIIIVDNHSTDGTIKYLSELALVHDEVHVELLSENVGGAGGFAHGIKVALEKTDNEWIFVADDDAVPESDMLKELESGYAEYKDPNEIAAICTDVINNGQSDIVHRRIIKKGIFRLKNITTAQSFSSPFCLDEATFVGLMVKRNVVEKIGLPIAELFIYCDDTEYSYRIKREGKILCIPSARIAHNITARPMQDSDWRKYYSVRNEIYFMREYFPSRFYKYWALNYYVRHVSLLSIILKHRSKGHRTLYRTAISDGKKGRLGKHPVYRP